MGLDTVSDSVKVYAMNTLPDQINEHKGFWGTSEELLQRAHELAKLVGLDHTKINLRLVRYYSTEGVLDKPDRLGREAAYNFKHLLQLILARQLSQKGVSLSLVKRLTQTLDAEKLIQKILSPEEKADKLIKEEKAIALSQVKPINQEKEQDANFFRISIAIAQVRSDIEKMRERIFHENSKQDITIHKFLDEQDMRLKSLAHSILNISDFMKIGHNEMLRHVKEVERGMLEQGDTLRKIEEKLDKNSEGRG